MLVDIRKWYTASRAISIRAGRDLLMSPDGARRHGFEVALVLITVAALLPYFAGGDPPGVDAPTFLHFAWVLEQSFHGSPAGFLDDPWWYGGLPYLQAYSPGGYGLVGLAAALSPMEIAASFKLVMAVAFAATAVLTFRLGRTLGLRPLFAFTGAALLVLSYPVLSGIGLYGWLPTMASMPLALAAVIALEKWIARGGVKLAVLTGAFLGMSLVAHHMTAIAFSIVIAVRLGMYMLDNRPDWRVTGRFVLWSSVTAVVVSAWWAIPFLMNTLSVGFQREIAGNWQFGFGTVLTNVFNRGLIGIETYPSYIGIAQGLLGIGGSIYAIVYRTRMRGTAVALLVLLWFSMGASVNPLIKVYPLSGLDVSRFGFYAAPLLALVAAASVQELASSKLVSARPAAVYVMIAVILVLPMADAFATRDTLSPVEEPEFVRETVDWIGANVEPDSKILAVGFRNWDGYWIPARTGLPIMDGWYDEGAANWRDVREYRLMGWLGEMDIDRLHEVMIQQDTDYLVVVDWDSTDGPWLFSEAADARADLFAPVGVLDGAVVYRLQ